MNFQKITKCRSCATEPLLEILNLGFQPLANALSTSREINEIEKFPLVLVQCSSCGLLQIDVNVNPELMFSNYNWVTSTSKSTIEHCKKFARESINRLKFNPVSVLEVGSNDGTLLREYINHHGICKLVGVEPAINLTIDYDQRILAENSFFTSLTALSIKEKYGEFDLVIARNVFSHVPDFRDVIFGVTQFLKDKSVFLMEFHWAYDILIGLHYDSIYHEHTYYHSIFSVSNVLKEFGLKPFDAFKSPISGGSIVLVSSLESREPTKELNRLQKMEAEANLNKVKTWKDFGVTSLENIRSLRNVINSFSGKRICALGASARSSTILNAIGKETNEILSIGENNPRKWGKYSPGVGLPIESVEDMVKKNPDLIIIFPFNFKEEIVNQLLSLNWHGSIVFPIPHPPKMVEI